MDLKIFEKFEEAHEAPLSISALAKFTEADPATIGK